MIIDWHDKEAEKIFHNKFSSRLPQDIQRAAKRKLDIIDAAASINDLRIPKSNHLEALIGKMTGPYSIRINDKFLICFYWNNGSPIIDCITNYH